MRQSAAEPSGGRVTSLLFACTGNTCRSVMAEALARRRFGDAVRVSSAGMRPQQPADAKNAIEALRADFGLDVSGHVPRSLQDVDLGAFDHVIVLDKSVARQLTGVPKDKLIVQHIDDPWGDDPSQYRQCALRIMQLVSTLPVEKASP
jgi:protein-tyrosine-phosphatase